MTANHVILGMLTNLIYLNYKGKLLLLNKILITYQQ
nr:MAG TPA: hypothetical protein [Caudoviricetes sp.]